MTFVHSFRRAVIGNPLDVWSGQDTRVKAGPVGGGGGWIGCELTDCKSLDRKQGKLEGHQLGNLPQLKLKAGCATLQLCDCGHVAFPL